MKKNILCLALCAAALVGCGENVASGTNESQEPVPGPKGEQGASVLTGEGAPSDSLGRNGDSYIDTTTFDFYAKEEDAWSKVGNIKGADGENGFDGKNGLNGQNGKNGLSFLSGNGAPIDSDGVDGDLYIDTSTYDLYKKEDGTWSKTGNIKGDKGDKGEDATAYYPNTFLPSEGGYIYSDKGSYSIGETIKINQSVDSNYELKAIEVIYDGVKSVYASTTGLDDLLTNGIKAKENGYVFKPIFFDTTKTYAVSDLTKIGENGNGTYTLSEDTYGSLESGVTLSSQNGIVALEGQVDTEGKPATTVYLNAKSTFLSDYLFLKNINFKLANDYVDSFSLLEFKNTFASFSNCYITIDKETDVALSFSAGSFGIKDVTIDSEASATNEAYLKTAVLFGEKEETKFSRVVVDNLSVNNVKKASSGLHAGSIFKSYWDTPYFNFEIKNSTFGTADTKIGEVWAHFRQKDYISTRFGIDNNLYKKYQKTASVKIEDTNIYSDLTNDSDYYSNFALITFHLMQNASDDSYTTRRVFADILINVENSKLNDTSFEATKVKYGQDDGNVPLVTLYLYDDDDGWYGNSQINYFQAVYPYATVDGNDAPLATGLYPDIN